MRTVLYADVLFLVNFSMDYLSLYAAGKLLSLRMRVRRMLFAAALGGLYGVLVTALNAGRVLSAVTAVLFSAVMTAAAYGSAGGGRSFLQAALAVWGSGALLAGFMTLFSGIFGGSFPGGGGADILCAACAAVYGFTRLLRRRLGRGYAEVRIPYGENVYEGRALIDSGNLLTDPLSGLPVILMRETEARRIAGDEVDGKFRGRIATDAGVRGGVRAVPVGNGARILYGFLCPDVRIRQGKRHWQKSAVVCVDFAAGSGYGGCGVLLPAGLLI